MLWNEGSGASSFLCRTEKFGLETDGGLCRLSEMFRRRSAHGNATGRIHTCVLWRSREQCDGLIPCVDESAYLSFLHIEPDDNHQDWLLLVNSGVFYLLAAICRSAHFSDL